MNLLELPLAPTTAHANAAAPAWACGCFVRRSITFFTGVTDTTTLVVWIQSRGLTFDLRLAPSRPRVANVAAIAALPVEDVVRLAEAEGGLAVSAFVPGPEPYTGAMNWGSWVRAQLHDGWAEPGVLRRAGDCLVEFAPSGAYVEDWRAQPSDAGRLIGLELVTETDAESGALLHAGGGLIVAGRHAGFVRGRPRPLPAAERLVELVRDGHRDRALIDDVFAVEASYGTRAPNGEYVVQASTLPFREGEPLLSLDGFTVHDGELVQRTRAGERLVERRFRVETSEGFDGAQSTVPAAEAERWLEREAPTLLRHAR